MRRTQILNSLESSNFYRISKANVTLTFVLDFGHCQFYIFIKFWFLSVINLCIYSLYNVINAPSSKQTSYEV